jgi:hypothetical protein
MRPSSFQMQKRRGIVLATPHEAARFWRAVMVVLRVRDAGGGHGGKAALGRCASVLSLPAMVKLQCEDNPAMSWPRHPSAAQGPGFRSTVVNTM